MFFAVAMGAHAADKPAADDFVRGFFTRHCVDCHGATDPEGGVDLLHLPGANFAQSAAAWNKVLSALRFSQMPPPDAKQPPAAELEQVAAWIGRELATAGQASDIEHKLRQPAYANLLNHEKLFDGSVPGPAYSPPRLWRLHPEAYDIILSGYGRELPFGGPLSKPFLVGDDKGLISNFADLVEADSAALGQYMLNCQQIAQLQTTGFKRMEVDRVSKQMVERIYHRRPEAFTAIIDGDQPATDEQIAAAVADEVRVVLSRDPTAEESAAYVDLLRRSIEIGGKERGLKTLAMAVLLRPESIFRMEVGLGPADEFGRRLLSPRETAYAIAYALTDTPPDKLLFGPPQKNDRSQRPTGSSLLELAEQGKLATREDVRRAVAQIWDNGAVDKPRILRFFREFFGYHHADMVFKGDRAGKEFSAKHLIQDADDLVMYHVRRDRDVLKELLTTDEYFVYGTSSPEDYERRIQGITGRIKADNTKDANYRYFIERVQKGLHAMPQGNPTWRVTVRFYNLQEDTWDYPIEQPFKMPAGQRVGLLTHPAWLAAWSGNFDNDPIRRGKWIREHLLAGSLPDVPITVDASVPEDPHKTLRQRLEKTRDAYCWTCHQRMDPLGLPFEAYDDFGQYRTAEGLGPTQALRKPKNTAPVVTTGQIIASGDPSIDGPVADVRELMERLADSPRARQSFVRHAFRYWMGRNETLDDSPTLLAAEKAYVDGGGSFKQMVISLLTSDSFLYRK